MNDQGTFYQNRIRRLLGWFLIFLFVLIIEPHLNALQQEAKLTLWTHHRHMQHVLKQLISEFNITVGRKKGIKLFLRILGDDASEIFQEAQKRGEGPDLYSSNFYTGYPDPFKAGAQTWFDDMPGFQEWKQQWPAWYWIEGVTTYKGHVIAIPAQLINSRLIYNKDLFRAIGRDPNQPPRSYEELKTVARQITAIGKGRVYGFAFCGADSWWMEWMPGQWAEANGDRAYWDWINGEWALQGYYRVFQLILDLQKEGSLFPGPTTLTNDALRAQFAEGRIGMFMGETWDVGVLNEQFPAKCDWGVGPIPTYDGKFHGKPRAMIIGGLWSINGQSRHKFEAWEVVKWFNRYEVRAKIYEQGACIDPDPLVAARYVKKIPALKGFKAFAESLDQDYIATYPNLPGWKIPEDNLYTVLRRLLNQGGDPKLELTCLERIWNQKLDNYFKNNGVKREWNVYPEFNPITGQLGSPLEKPHFK